MSARYTIISLFIAGPLIFSMVSSYHIYHAFRLMNVEWVAVTIAVCVEIMQIAILAALVAMSNLKKSFVWIAFGILTVLQIWGNMYYVYDFASVHYDKLAHYTEMVGISTKWTAKMLLTLVGGLPVPVVSLLLLKSMVDYLKDFNDERVKELTPEIKGKNVAIHYPSNGRNTEVFVEDVVQEEDGKLVVKVKKNTTGDE